jgi:RHS repeat-associated protein
MQAMGSVYHYDQLQRLTEMKAFYNTNTDNSWAGMAATDDYFNSYTYDLNGNIKTLKRYADNQQLMDDFSYAYPDNPVTLKPWNRLNHVVDNVGTTTFTTADIESQDADNFDYDKLGQLLSDESEGISNIVWRKGDKKVKSIVRDDLNSSQVDFVYNPFGQRILKVEKPRSNGQFVSSDQWKYSYYSYDANGQVMAVYDLEKATLATGKATLTEQHLYGSSRLGMRQTARVLYNNGALAPIPGPVYQNVAGERYYEITNHLGNVNVVIKDRKTATGGGIGSLYEAVEIQTADYYPFGMLMPGRNPSPSERYRYAYNGMETDPEVKGEGNSYTTEFRQYDPRLGRWLSLDPLRMKYPYISPFVAFNNNPIFFVDPNGGEPNVAQATTIEGFIQYLKDNKLTTVKDIYDHLKANSTVAPRYIYTPDKGWMDLNHVFCVMVWGAGSTTLLEPASGQGFIRDMLLGDGAASSYYSYEDLPSNYVGDDLRSRLILLEKEKGKNLEGDELYSFILNNLPASVNPNEAPNYTFIPADKDRDALIKNGQVQVLTPSQLKTGKYVPQNFTKEPFDLKKFPPASNSIYEKELKEYKPVENQSKKRVVNPVKSKAQDLFDNEFKLKEEPKKKGNSSNQNKIDQKKKE